MQRCSIPINKCCVLDAVCPYTEHVTLHPAGQLVADIATDSLVRVHLITRRSRVSRRAQLDEQKIAKLAENSREGHGGS